MKVLLVYTNTYDLLLLPPVGLSLMKEPLRRAGHVISVSPNYMNRRQV